MRSAQKQETLEVIESLHQAHEEIREALAKDNITLAQNMLAECQEFVISLGESIEKLEGEGHITISCIEEYCETLFQVYEELSDGQINANNAHKKLKKQLLKMENSVKNDISARKEVVFFPYKASMWDSLESVWKAADADPDCDAYVVPIPYYDKKPDGSLGQMHYEGNEYPKYVPITRYDEYNLNARRPDVIFIHNPYDECNYVTSVHPAFYAKLLKKYTDNLVYIPYFILNEIEPDNQEAIDGMKHFCFLPGTVYADRVIVQSEKMRQIYINEYIKAAKEIELGGEHMDRRFLERKFLGLGSPKFDKVRNTKKEDLEIPVEWLKIIEKPDGSWKTVILYNTSIVSLLRYNEKMLVKMKSVFRTFKENKNEIALLWRPHPLIRATVESMRPEFRVEYDEIVKKYREEGWGIYDDTADMNRAIGISDAYYGDPSSLVQLYQKTERPIMIQNVEVGVSEQ